MVKFRRLTIEELKELEQEFIAFLVVNGVEAEMWEEIKKETPDKAEEIVDQFSDVVFTSVFRKKEYIDFIAEDSIKCFHFQPDQAVMVAIQTNNTEVNFMESSLDQLQKEEFEVYSTNKKYASTREEEMFQLIEKGARLSDGDLYKKLCLAL